MSIKRLDLQSPVSYEYIEFIKGWEGTMCAEKGLNQDWISGKVTFLRCSFHTQREYRYRWECNGSTVSNHKTECNNIDQ